MSKGRRNILVLGFIALIACYLCSLVFVGTGSPFENGGFLNGLGSGARQLIFGDDSIVRPSELDTDCLLSDNTLEFDGNCSLDIDGSDENIDFDTPRDLRLTMCWGAILVNVDSENIEVEDSPLPTEKNGESLSINVFHEGDTEIDLSCETDNCRVALNDFSCPSQTAVDTDSIEQSGCTINAEGLLTFHGSCTLTVDSNESDDEDNPNNNAFDRDATPRVLRFYYCSGDLLMSSSSDDNDLMPDYAVRFPEQANRWNVDIYGENVQTLGFICLPNADNTACLLNFRNAQCPS